MFLNVNALLNSQNSVFTLILEKCTMPESVVFYVIEHCEMTH